MSMFPKKYAGAETPTPLRALVERLVPLLSEGPHPALAVLREQYRQARIREVELTGAGFYVDFDIAVDAPLTEPRNFEGGNATIILQGARCEARCVLFVRDGRSATLEGYTYDEPWPEDPDAVLAIEDVMPVLPPSAQ